MSEQTSQPINSTYTDLYLEMLLTFLDREDAKGSSASVSLLIGGTLVCGDLISHDAWLEAFQEWMSGLGDGAKFVGDLFAETDRVSAERENGEEPLGFVHLKNVRIVTNYRGTLDGEAAQGMESPLWRGRLVDIQGWTLGRPS